MDTSGFYKQTEEGWFYAPNAVHSRDYTLERNGNLEPIDGWQWYDKAPAGYIIWEYEKNNLEDGNTE
jgi:hypothetical protein